MEKRKRILDLMRKETLAVVSTVSKSGKELEDAKRIHNKKLPDAAKFSNLPEIRFFKIKPKWIRYSDLNKNPWEVFEIKF